MTAATARTSGRLAIPLTQNTAPVFEFNCLYSQDVRRKHKRWKDGFLKYHTFNKRVLVYDVPRNLIGDMHWLGEEDPQEGDELKLEKGGALVQVADKVGQTETDLTELRNSKNRRPAHTGTSSPPRSYSRPNFPATTTGARQGLPLKNKSLNAVLGTPKGPIGKAVLPTKSPFETRCESMDGGSYDEGRAAKRPRTANLSVQMSERHFQEATPTPAKNILPRKECSVSVRRQNTNRLSTPLRQNTVIDLCDEEPGTFLTGLSSDIPDPVSSPLKQISDSNLDDGRSSSPFFQTQRLPRKELDPRRTSTVNAAKPQHQSINTTHIVERVTKQHTGSTVARRSIYAEPTVYRDQDESIDRTTKARHERIPVSRCIDHNKPGKVLRLATTAPMKKTLLCQEQVKSSTKRMTSNDGNSPSIDATEKPGNDDTRPRAVGESLRERLKRIDKKRGSTSRHTLDATTKSSHHFLTDYVVSQDGGNPPCLDLNSDEEMQISQEEEEQLGHLLAKRNDGKHSPLQSPLSPPPPPPPPAAAAAAQTTHKGSQPEEPASESPLHSSPLRSNPPPKHPTPESNLQSQTPTKHPDPAPADDTSPEPMAEIYQAEAIDLDSSSPEPEPPIFKDTNSSGFQRASFIDTKPTNNSSKFFRISRTPAKPPKPEVSSSLGPWSREAFDLFTWRPPNWDEEGWCVKE